MLYAGGDRYQGEWEHRFPEGEGTFQFADGRTYTCHWKKGKPMGTQHEWLKQAIARRPLPLQSGCLSGDCQNGQGVYAYPDGSKYVGLFAKGKLHGKGVWHYPNGVRLKGNFEGSLPQGKGAIYFDDQHFLAGTWMEGEYVGRDRSRIDIGCVEGDCQNGQGTYVFQDGRAMYVGPFKNGRPEGDGLCYFINGNIYEGEWLKGSFHGYGSLLQANGATLSGEWQYGNYQILSSDLAYTHTEKSGDTGPEGNPSEENDGFQYLSMLPAKDPPTRKRRQRIPPESIRPSTSPFSKIEIQPTGKPEQKEEMPANDIEENAQNENLSVSPSAYAFQEKPTETTIAASAREELTTGALGFTPDPITTTTHLDKRKPRVWAVVVGVAAYHHMPALRYTDDDAYRIYAFLKSPEGGALPDEQIRILVDEDANKRNIVTSMMDVFYKAGPRDLVILYFSGHGLQGSFLPFDFDGFHNKLYHHEINDILRNSPAAFKLCIADACHSGSLVSLKGGDLPNLLSEYYNNLAQMEPGSALLMSSKSDEISLESSGLRQGVFTHYLIRGLKGEADGDANHRISLYELYGYLSENVRQYTNYRQSPMMKGDLREDMIIGVTR